MKRTGVFTEKVSLLGTIEPQAFFVPKGCRIDGMVLEKRGATTGTIKLGTTYTPKVMQQEKLGNIQAVTAPGIVTVTLPGVEAASTKTFYLNVGDAENTAKAIAAETYPNWLVWAEKNESDQWDVHFKAAVESALSVGSTGIVINDTGFSHTSFTRTTQGVDHEAAVAAVYSAVFEIDNTDNPIGEDDIVFTFDGGTVTVTLAIDEDPLTIQDVIDAILEEGAAFDAEGWVVTDGGDGKIVLTAKVGGEVSADPTIVPDGATNLKLADGVKEEVEGKDEIDAVKEVVTLNTLALSTVGEGVITIDLNGDIHLVDVITGDASDDVDSIITKIEALELALFEAEGSGTDVIFTAKDFGAHADAVYAIYYKAVGGTATPASVKSYAATLVADDVLEATAVPATHMAVKEYSPKVAVFSTTKKVPLLIQMSDAAILGNLYVSYERFTK